MSAAETLDPAAFPGIDAFTAALQQARRSLKLPRRCRAVVWGLPDGATRSEPAVAPLIEPLTRAGFKVKRVVTPCNALGAIARLRISRTGGAMCWLGVNRNGVAIVVIRPGKLLYSHSFAWDSSIGATGSQARLLQRYSLVAFLAPEVRRAIAAAKEKGAVVDGIVTCGNLPDLRALTMPLIEELDVEVETLDSLEGLIMTPALADRLSEVAPAIRLACAGAFARETRTVDQSRRRSRQRVSTAAVLPVVAVVAALAGGYWWYMRHSKPAPPPPPAAARRSASPVSQPLHSATPSLNSTPPTSAPAASPPKGDAVPPKGDAVPPKGDVTPPKGDATAPQGGPPKTDRGAQSGGRDAASPKGNTAPPGVSPIPPKGSPVPPKGSAISPGVGAAPPKGGATALKGGSGSDKGPADRAIPARPASAAPASRTPALNPPAAAADKVETTPAVRSSAKLPELLKDPVPKITAILVSADRRLATMGDDGQIIAVGDTVGRRVVVAIDDKTVLLREPSGVQIRVALGGRVVGVERPDR